MDAHRDEEAAASPLLAAPPPPPAGAGRSHAADVRILSTAFLFVFPAYSAAQNLQSTVNAEGDLGTVSLGILYTSFTLFAAVASPVVARLGSKRALVVGTSGYVLFILANLVPSWRMLLIIPLMTYFGLQHAFVSVVFTKSIITHVFGISGVGGAMAIYGAADAVSHSELLSRLLSYLVASFLQPNGWTAWYSSSTIHRRFMGC